MKLTLRLIENLRRLVNGEVIPYSSLPTAMAESLLSEGLLTQQFHGSRRNLRVSDLKAFMDYLPHYNEALKDPDAALQLFSGDNSRAAQSAISGNSKIKARRSCPGFLVNTFSSMECSLDGSPYIIAPPEGSAIYIADWKSFSPPLTALIVGVENMENFIKIRMHGKLFDHCLDITETGIIFVARYAFSSDLSRWLERLPNRYVHFGDFDLAGIDIFLTQFKPYVGERGSYLIPPDIESRISKGSCKRYDDQFQKYYNLTSADDDINRLIGLIHQYRRTYDQEGYIEAGSY